jgi:hypothetical protein
LLHALRQHGHGKHRHVAAVGPEILDQAGEGRVHVLHLDAQVAPEFGRQVDVDATELLCAGIAEAHPVVVGPDAHAHGAAGLHPLLRGAGRGGPGNQRCGG